MRQRRRDLGLMILLIMVGVAWGTVRAETPVNETGPLTAAQRETILTEALAAYDAGIATMRRDPAGALGSFEDATARFQMLVDDGVTNGLLFYNLGNAQYQYGDLGRAIASYRRALRLRPGDDRIRANLESARSVRETQIEPAGGRRLADALFGWPNRFALGTRLNVAVGAWIVLWLALAFRVVHRNAAWIWIAVIAVVIAIVAGAATGRELFGTQAPEGVTTRGDVTVRKGNGENFAPQFQEPLSEGVEFTILEVRGDWWRIELPDGGTGWIPAGVAMVI